MIIEVISPSTGDRDKRFTFFRNIQIPSLNEYIMVNSTVLEIDIIQRQSDDNWEITQLFSSEATVRLVSLGLNPAVTDIYNRVALTVAS